FTTRELCDNDGVLDFGEKCDDGNDDSGDGCSPFCEIEPTCRPDGGGPTAACSSECGDGFLLPGELNSNNDPAECDDGNTADGGGCSALRLVEEGWTCSIPTATPTVLDVPVVFRDVIAIPTSGSSRHQDFEDSIAGDSATPGLVGTIIGNTGKPIYGDICDW